MCVTGSATYVSAKCIIYAHQTGLNWGRIISSPSPPTTAEMLLVFVLTIVFP